MKKDVKQFIYQGNGDQTYYYAGMYNNNETLVLNNIFRKNDIADVSKAYIDINCEYSVNALTLYWDKSGVATNFSNIESDSNFEKLDYTTSGSTLMRYDVTKVFYELQKAGTPFKNQRFIIMGKAFIPQEDEPDFKIVVHYDHKRGFRERTATVPFEVQNVKGFVDLFDKSVHFDVVDTVGSGRMPISVKHHYNSNSRREYDQISLENGSKKTVHYLCGCGFKLNYQQYLIVDSVASGTLSDGESNAYYTWIDAKGNYIHFAKKAINNVISCEQPFTLVLNGANYEITDISNNKLIFEPTNDSAVYRLKRMCDNFNNTITLSYDGICLTEISSSSGDLVRFNYDEDTNLMLNMVEVLDNDTQVITTFSTNGDPSLTDILSQGGNNDVHFHCGYYYDDDKEEDIYYVDAIYGANGVGYFFDYQSATHLEVYSIGTTDGIVNGNTVVRSYDSSKSFLSNCNKLMLYSIHMSDRKVFLTEERNGETKNYLFDYFGRCVSQYEEKYDGTGAGNPQARSIILTPNSYSVKAESVSNAADLIQNAYEKPTACGHISDLFTQEQKLDAEDFISAVVSKNTADKNVYFANSSIDKLLSFKISGSQFFKEDEDGNEIKSPNDYLLSAWALADSFAIKEYAKGLKVNNKAEQILNDSSSRYQEIYGSHFYGSNRKFELCVDVSYSFDDGDETDTFSATFDPSNKKLQYLSVPVRLRPNAKSSIYNVEVYVRYANNNGGIYLFGASLKSANWSFEQFNNDKQLIYARSSEKEAYYTEYSVNPTTKLLETVTEKEEFGAETPYTETYTYNTNKSISSVTDSKGFITEYVYDTANNNGDLLKTKTFKRVNGQDTSAFVIKKTFQTNTGNVSEEFNKLGNLAMTYNYANGVLTSVTPVNSSQIDYSYDSTYKFVNSISATVDNTVNKNNTAYAKGVEISHDDKISPEDLSGTTFTYDYDGFGRVVQIKMNGSSYCSISYDNENQKTVTYANGEKERIKTSKNDTELSVQRQLPGASSFSSTEIELKLDSYGRFKQLIDETTGGNKHIAQYDDDGKLIKTGVEGEDDDFYTVYHKREFNDKNQIVNVSYEHDTDQLSGENKYLDRVDYEYEDEIDGDLTKLTHKNIGAENRTFDELDRVESLSKFDNAFKKVYSYHQNSSKNLATNLLFTENYFVDNEQSDAFTYLYDDLNRLTMVARNNIMNKKYTYDGLGRLSREDNVDLNKTFVFTYDKSGNILSRKEYAFTVGSLDAKVPTKTVNYTYQRNQLWSYDGEGCSYNVLGNPIIYRGKMATWTKIHRLASFNGVDFAYNYAGIRTSKTFDEITTKYAYDGETLITEQKGDDLNSKLVYYYGFDGVTAFNYGGENYFYQKNTFGDIVGIYNSSKQLVAKYVYDAWGNHKVLNPDGLENTSADFIGNINPFRYRSYYFDVETGFYYLQSRYYDPQVGRFISMDAVEYLDPQTINGLNLYIYCGNNPVMGYDPEGTWNWGKFLAVAAIGVALAAVVVASGGSALAVGMVAVTALVASYAAGKESAMVLDFSVSGSLPNQSKKIGLSVVIDFKTMKIEGYYHSGYALSMERNSKSGISANASYSVGIIDNYVGQGSYGGAFISAGASCSRVGVEHCFDPNKPHDEAVNATCITFSAVSNYSVYGAYDYYWKIF